MLGLGLRWVHVPVLSLGRSSPSLTNTLSLLIVRHSELSYSFSPSTQLPSSANAENGSFCLWQRVQRNLKLED